MARKRTPCEWCSDDVYGDYVEGPWGYCLWYEVYPFNNLIAVIAQANDEVGDLIEKAVELPMNFCLNCGRDLRRSTGA